MPLLIVSNGQRFVKGQPGRVVVLTSQQLTASFPRSGLPRESLLTCTGFTRVSDDKQTVGYSTAAQAEAVRRFAGSQRIACNGTVRFTGRVRNRKLTGSMIASIQATVDRADVLLVDSLDRLTRRDLFELAQRIQGTLYVCPLGEGGFSHDSLRSHAFKRSKYRTSRTPSEGYGNESILDWWKCNRLHL